MTSVRLTARSRRGVVLADRGEHLDARGHPALMPRMARRAGLIGTVAAVLVGVSSCGDGGEPLIVVSSTDVRVLSPDEVRNTVYVNYVVGIHDLEPAYLRQALCSFYATDADIETMLARLSEFEQVERFSSYELIPEETGREYVARVVLGDIEGKLRVHVTNPGVPCVDRVEVSNPALGPYLVPGAAQI